MAERLQFHYSSKMPVSNQELYDWHMAPDAFHLLMPAWQKGTIYYDTPDLREGTKAEIRIKDGFIPIHLSAEHSRFIPGVQFEDRLTKSPFRYWKHTHRFEDIHKGESMLMDQIEYKLPLSSLSHRFVHSRIDRELRHMFRYRHAITYRELELRKRWQNFPRYQKLKSVVISGASGMVGTKLQQVLRHMGYEVIALHRSNSRFANPEHYWDPYKDIFPVKTLNALDSWAWIHLSGENIASGRWSDDKKKRIRDSRVLSTEKIGDCIKHLESKPSTFLSSSGIGIYGADVHSLKTEEDAAGSGFLAEVCQEWEAASQKISIAETRSCQMRLGVVLDPHEGALGKVLPLFKLGLGGKIGDGQQWMSWISLQEVVNGFREALFNDNLEGPINLCHPNTCQSLDYSKALANVLRKPHLVPAPQSALKLAFGEMAHETILASNRATPQKLEKAGFPFHFQNIRDTVAHILGR